MRTTRPIRGWLVVRWVNLVAYPLPELYTTQNAAYDAKNAMKETEGLKYANLAVVAQR